MSLFPLSPFLPDPPLSCPFFVFIFGWCMPIAELHARLYLLASSSHADMLRVNAGHTRGKSAAESTRGCFMRATRTRLGSEPSGYRHAGRSERVRRMLTERSLDPGAHRAVRQMKTPARRHSDCEISSDAGLRASPASRHAEREVPTAYKALYQVSTGTALRPL